MWRVRSAHPLRCALSKKFCLSSRPACSPTSVDDGLPWCLWENPSVFYPIVEILKALPLWLCCHILQETVWVSLCAANRFRSLCPNPRIVVSGGSRKDIGFVQAQGYSHAFAYHMGISRFSCCGKRITFHQSTVVSKIHVGVSGHIKCLSFQKKILIRACRPSG